MGGSNGNSGSASLLDTARKTWQRQFLLAWPIDGDKNFYAAFSFLNRIEKYSPDGSAALSMDRVLPYEIEDRIEKSTMEARGKVVPSRKACFHSRQQRDRC